MLLRAAREMDLDLSRSYLVGDAVSDVLAAQVAGVRPILVLTGRGEEQVLLLEAQGLADCPVVADLPAAVDLILEESE
jgi:D-glycero-D-manno-heptose 1,7-bisphosphate phosphatase